MKGALYMVVAGIGFIIFTAIMQLSPTVCDGIGFWICTGTP